eukprot:1380385-Amorphochlora_amoeboformis.AAC.1
MTSKAARSLTAPSPAEIARLRNAQARVGRFFFHNQIVFSRRPRARAGLVSLSLLGAALWRFSGGPGRKCEGKGSPEGFRGMERCLSHGYPGYPTRTGYFSFDGLCSVNSKGEKEVLRALRDLI